MATYMERMAQEANFPTLHYRGWNIFYFPRGGQHWRAEQYGVGMCGNNPEMLKRMIDRKIEDRRTVYGRID